MDHLALLPSILILLVFSRILGNAFRRIGYPEVVGELLAGVLLGPTLLGIINPTLELKGISELAVFLIIFSAGLEMELDEVLEAFKGHALWSALLAFAVPILGGLGVARLHNIPLNEALIIGLCISITALPVVIRLLDALNIIDSPLAHRTIGSAILIDILALLVLGVLMDTPAEGDLTTAAVSIGATVLKILGFMGFVVLSNSAFQLYAKKRNKTSKKVGNFLKKIGREGIFGVSILFVLIFASMTEALGFHFVIGTFFGGVLLNRALVGKFLYENIESTLKSVSEGFLAPLFFAYIGLIFTTDAFQSPGLLVSILGVGLAAKTLGAWVGGRFAGLDASECTAMAILLNARGVMDLVVAEVALERGLMNSETFSSLVILALVSSTLAPFLFKLGFGKRAAAAKA